MNKENPIYFDGRGMDKVAENLMQQEWYQDRVKALAEQKDKKIVVHRYPHPMEYGFKNFKSK